MREQVAEVDAGAGQRHLAREQPHAPDDPLHALDALGDDAQQLPVAPLARRGQVLDGRAHRRQRVAQLVRDLRGKLPERRQAVQALLLRGQPALVGEVAKEDDPLRAAPLRRGDAREHVAEDKLTAVGEGHAGLAAVDGGCAAPELAGDVRGEGLGQYAGQGAADAGRHRAQQLQRGGVDAGDQQVLVEGHEAAHHVVDDRALLLRQVADLRFGLAAHRDLPAERVDGVLQIAGALIDAPLQRLPRLLELTLEYLPRDESVADLPGQFSNFIGAVGDDPLRRSAAGPDFLDGCAEADHAAQDGPFDQQDVDTACHEEHEAESRQEDLQAQQAVGIAVAVQREAQQEGRLAGDVPQQRITGHDLCVRASDEDLLARREDRPELRACRRGAASRRRREGVQARRPNSPSASPCRFRDTARAAGSGGRNPRPRFRRAGARRAAAAPSRPGGSP